VREPREIVKVPAMGQRSMATVSEREDMLDTFGGRAGTPPSGLTGPVVTSDGRQTGIPAHPAFFAPAFFALSCFGSGRGSGSP
jgi:hypothetical protein